VKEVVGIDDATAFRWDQAILSQNLPPPKLDDLRILLIDEKAVRKRHGYVTLVMNGATGELLYLAEGKKKESLQSFFDQLSPAQKASIVAVGMDRAGAYLEVVKAQLPDAAIVFDKFHLIANYHAVIDQVRRQEWRKASAEHRDVIKGQRYNLFRNPSNPTPQQTQSLMNPLHINRNLAVVYILKDALRKLWDSPLPLGRGQVPGPLVRMGGGLGHRGGAEVRAVAAEGQGRSVELLQASHHHRGAGRLQQHGQPHHPPRLRHPQPGLPVPQAATGIP
jgi:transposase